MTFEIAGLRMDPPEGFVTEELMLSLRFPEPTELREPRLLQTQTLARPSLIVHRRPAGDSPSLERIAGQLLAELSQAVVGLEGLKSGELVFADGAIGFVLSFEFRAGEKIRLRQFHALRLDDAELTTLTLTVGAELSADAEKGYLKAIASAVPGRARS